MESSNSQKASEVPKGKTDIPIGNNSENNIDENKDSTQKSKEKSSDCNKEEESEADEKEKKDFEEENKVMTGCTGAVIVEGDDLNATASSSKMNVPVEDSNATNRNIIPAKRLAVDADIDSTNGTSDSTKNDLAFNIIRTSFPSTSGLSMECSNPPSRKCAEVNTERPRITTRDGSEQCDLVSRVNAIHITNTANGQTSLQFRNGYVIATTSGTERSFIYHNMTFETIIASTQRLSIAPTELDLTVRQHLDNTEDENSENKILRAFLSSIESDEDEIVEESLEQSGVWTRKRKVDPLMLISSSAMSKHCMELRRKIAEAAAANQAKMVAPRPKSSGAISRGPPKIKRRYSRSPRGKNKADSSETSESSETSN